MHRKQAHTIHTNTNIPTKMRWARERERQRLTAMSLSKEARFTYALLAAATGSLTKTRFSQEEINVAFYTVSKNDVTPESFFRLP